MAQFFTEGCITTVRATPRRNSTGKRGSHGYADSVFAILEGISIPDQPEETFA